MNLSSILVFQLLKTATATAIAQRFPLRVGHVFQRYGFPKSGHLGVLGFVVNQLFEE
ncbi:MAG: hypothetical protein ACI8VW_000832 [bacterium]|jgi:hypothetical protein